MDNITPIVPSSPFIKITSHTSGTAVGCSFEISGNISAPVYDSIILEGNFVGSPLNASVNGTNWSANIVPNAGNNLPIRATLYYVDPVLGTASCSFDTVTVNVSKPTPAFTFSNSCAETTVAFTNQSTPFQSNTIVGQSWDFGNGQTSTTLQPNVSFPSHGVFTVQLTVTDNTGCEATLSQNITIYPLPEALFN